jgi:Carboxypeptidase regulatory-like domain
MRQIPRMIALASLALALCFAIAPPLSRAQQTAAGPNATEQDKQLASVGGTVVSAATGEPLKKARVSLANEDEQNPHPQATTTDSAGHFSIDRVAAGRYVLIVDRMAYMAQQYGQDRPDKPGAILTLAPGQKITDLLFRLQRMAVISGHVQDEDGEALPGINVEAEHRTSSRKRTQPDYVARATTDDLGDYRIFDLAPGKYSVRADPSGQISNGDETIDNRPQPAGVGYAPTYYPGTPDLDRASVIDVKAGEEVPRIDFLLTPKAADRTYKIRGHVSVALASDNSARNTSVVLVPRGADTFSFEDSHNGIADRKTGDFELKGIPPGAYSIMALGFDGSKMRTAAQDLDVINADVEAISLVITRGADIPGRVTFEGKTPSAVGDLVITLNPKDRKPPFAGWQQTEVKEDGSFVLKDVGDGAYSIHASSKCDDCYLKSAAANSVDLLASGLQITSGNAPSTIELVYSSHTGTVGGTVTNSDDLPAAGALVILVPDASPTIDADRTRRSTTDQYGHFEIRGVPPGKYHAFAFEKVDDDSADDPDYLKPFDNQSQSVEFSANENKTLQLKLIPAAAAE